MRYIAPVRRCLEFKHFIRFVAVRVLVNTKGSTGPIRVAEPELTRPERRKTNRQRQEGRRCISLDLMNVFSYLAIEARSEPTHIFSSAAVTRPG